MTITTIGYGDVLPLNWNEEIFFIFAMFFGASVYAYAVGTVCNLIQGLMHNTLQFQKTMDELNEYMKLRKAPSYLSKRVRSYAFYIREIEKTANEFSVLSRFSPSLRTEMLI